MLIIVDGMAIAYRAWYSLPAHIRGDGVEEGLPLVGYLMLRHLLDMIDDVCLDLDTSEFAVVMCWDRPGSSDRRRKMAIESGLVEKVYKGNRTENITDERRQAREAVSVLAKEFERVHRRLGIKSDLFEADDIIALLATNSAQSIIISRDMDFCQLLQREINSVIYNPYTEEYITRDSFIEEYGFPPKWWVLWKALAGDASDNWPGVFGMGPAKTTAFIRQVERTGVSVEAGIDRAVARWGEIVRLGVDLVTIPFMEHTETKYINKAFLDILVALGDREPFNWSDYFETFGIQRISIKSVQRTII